MDAVRYLWTTVRYLLLWVAFNMASETLKSYLEQDESEIEPRCMAKPTVFEASFQPPTSSPAYFASRGSGGEDSSVSRTCDSSLDRTNVQTSSTGCSTNNRQQKIVEAFRHAWRGYRDYAWGRDILLPVSRGHEEWFDLGVTLVDSLDTMYLMGLHEEFAEARQWVLQDLDVRKDKKVNVFETTIRIIGGLLGAYNLSNDALFKDKAVALADSLLPAFATRSGIPLSDVNLYTGVASAPKWSPESSVAEVTTIQMEFREISRLTGDSKYQELVDKALSQVQSQPLLDGLVHLFIDPHTGIFKSGTLTLGARADSYYEYLLKQWLQCNRTDGRFAEWYRTSVGGIEKHLMRQSTPSRLLFVGEQLSSGQFSPKMDHLVCFLPGVLALGWIHGVETERSGYHLELARQLMITCHQMYFTMPTGLSAELVYFGQNHGDSDIMVKENDKHNLLRPEAVESLFILYRATGDKQYQDWGWKMFEAFEEHCRVESGGYTSISDVSSASDPKPRDKMESFFLAETLKYLYLLLGDDDRLLPLDEYVFNTEAHPLPIWNTMPG